MEFQKGVFDTIPSTPLDIGFLVVDDVSMSMQIAKEIIDDPGCLMDLDNQLSNVQTHPILVGHPFASLAIHLEDVNRSTSMSQFLS